MVLHHIYIQRGPHEEHAGSSDSQTLLFLFFYQQFELKWRLVEVKKDKAEMLPLSCRQTVARCSELKGC